MIVEKLQDAVVEINGLWDWVIGMIAGWGLTFTLVVIAIVYAHVRLNQLTRKIKSLENQRTANERDLSFRIGKLEK
jgi:uncharacterized membrane protein YciS (DUF1049 family)